MINKKYISLVILFIAIIVPQVSFAVWTNITGAFNGIADWLYAIGNLLFAAATVVFFWGLVKFIMNPDKKDEGKNMMIWGIIALFVMFTIWGIISFIQISTIDTDTVSDPAIPGLSEVF